MPILFEVGNVGRLEHLLSVALKDRELLQHLRLAGFACHGQIVMEFQVHAGSDDLAFVNVDLGSEKGYHVEAEIGSGGLSGPLLGLEVFSDVD